MAMGLVTYLVAGRVFCCIFCYYVHNEFCDSIFGQSFGKDVTMLEFIFNFTMGVAFGVALVILMDIYINRGK